jgi:hypothetical protein
LRRYQEHRQPGRIDVPTRVPPPQPRSINQDPPGIGLLVLLREDLRIFDRRQPGRWAIWCHRFGNRRMGDPEAPAHRLHHRSPVRPPVRPPVHGARLRDRPGLHGNGIGASTVVTADVAPTTTVIGNPPRPWRRRHRDFWHLPRQVCRTGLTASSPRIATPQPAAYAGQPEVYGSQVMVARDRDRYGKVLTMRPRDVVMEIRILSSTPDPRGTDPSAPTQGDAPGLPRILPCRRSVGRTARDHRPRPSPAQAVACRRRDPGERRACRASWIHLPTLATASVIRPGQA